MADFPSPPVQPCQSDAQSWRAAAEMWECSGLSHSELGSPAWSSPSGGTCRSRAAFSIYGWLYLQGLALMQFFVDCEAELVVRFTSRIARVLL